jgi:SAM-dependent methyltransferase
MHEPESWRGFGPLDHVSAESRSSGSFFATFEPLSVAWWLGLFKRASAAGYLIRLRDFWLFIEGAQTDAWIARLRTEVGDHDAFETIYRESADPWRSVDPRYCYQLRKYDVLVSFVPAEPRYRSALDLGCGLGTLSRLLAGKADHVLGLDVAQSAVDRARTAHAGSNVSFDRGDILDLPSRLNGQFDLIMIVDVLYYLPFTSEDLLTQLAARIADLSANGGIVVLANHFFFPWDKETRVTRRIHEAFLCSSRFNLVSEHWRPFYLTTVFRVSRPDAVQVSDEDS